MTLFAALTHITNHAVMYGLNFAVQTTFVLTLGTGAALLTKRLGPAAQSFVLRVFLAASLMIPVTAVFLEQADFGKMTFTIMLPSSTDYRINESTGADESGISVSGADTEHIASGTSPVTGSLTDNNKSGVRYDNPAHSDTESDSAITTSLHRRAVAFALITVIWLSVSLLLGFRLFTGVGYVRTIRDTAVSAGTETSEVCRSLSDELKVRNPRVYCHPAVKSPFLGGIIKPFIMLPDAQDNGKLPIFAILLHELAHLKRHDNIWNLAGKIAKILIPFQPLHWLYSRWITETGDYVCDDFVVNYTKNKRDYASGLLSAALSHQSVSRDIGPAPGFSSSESPLRRRIKRILHGSYERPVTVGLCYMTSTVTLCLIASLLSGIVGFDGKYIVRNSIASAVLGKTSDLVRFPVILSENLVDRSTEHSKKQPDEKCSSHNTSGVSFPVHGKKESENGEYSEYRSDAGITGDMKPQRHSSTRCVFPDTIGKGMESGINHYDTGETPNINLKKTYESSCDFLRSIAETGRLVPELWNTPSLAVPATLPSAGRSSRTSPKRLEVIIDYDFDSGESPDEMQKQLNDLYRSLSRDKLCPVWSPDGSWIAFNDERFGIWIVSAEGGEPRLIFSNYYSLHYNGYKLHLDGLRTLCFTPDGSEITYMRYIIDESKGTKVFIEDGERFYYQVVDPVPVIESVNIETRKTTRIADEAICGRWNNDGNYFAYISKPQDSYKHLIVKNMSSGEEHELDSNLYTSLCFSPDGFHLFATSLDMDETTKLVKISVDGGFREERIIAGKLNITDISPDSEWLLYTDTTSGMSQCAYNLLTGELTAVIPEVRSETSNARFSPDGSEICLNIIETDIYGEKSEIYLSDFDITPDATSYYEKRIPYRFELKKSRPNPFNNSTTIEFSIPADGFTSLVIYNMLGQKVRELVAESMTAGTHTVVWDGRDDHGNTLSSGIYLSLLQMGKHRAKGRMTLMK